jgi:23S rRNA pseudouridine2605 synthase
LLLTNDGELANRLMHPKFNVKKTYLVRVHKPIEQKDIDKIQKGVRLPDGIMKFDKVSCYTSSKETRAQVTLHSGKKRIIRRVFETLGYRMCRLERVAYGNIDTKGLSRGQCRELTRVELKNLRSIVKL